METIATNLKHVNNTITAACARANRDPAEVTLVAVSKTRTPEEIMAAAAAGVQHFGENRVEEAQDKLPKIHTQAGAALTWHMIGHIQSRKARHIQTLFDMVHSVDNIKLAEKLSRLTAPQAPLNILLQVNISGEDAKTGFNAVDWQNDVVIREQLLIQAKYVFQLSGLRIHGLMTMAPIVADPEETRPVFASLAKLRDALSQSLEVALPELSMGMTDDYAVAIEEGATLVRIGRAIFGQRV